MSQKSQKSQKFTDFGEYNEIFSQQVEAAKKAGMADLVCSKCGAKESEAKLCSCYDDGKLALLGAEGSHIECWAQIECRERRKGDKDSPKDSNKYSNKGSTKSSSVPYTPKCRHKPTLAFELAGIKFYGGSKYHVEDLSLDQTEWLVVSLLGSKSDNVLWSSIPNWLESLNVYAKTMSPQLCIDWSDMQAPKLSPGFWRHLVALAVHEGYKNILFYCMGGHGRTGTALSSVLIECADISVKAAVVGTVRANYCEEAVETKAQVTYLEMLRKVAIANPDNPEVELEAEAEAETKPAKNYGSSSFDWTAALGDGHD